MARQTRGYIWYELLTTDVEAASRFYGSVVGWAATDSGMPGMDYRLWSIGGANVGGLMTMPSQTASNSMRSMWLGYVAVADVDESVTGVTAAGGAVHMPPTDIPGVGRIALVADPQGALFYVMAPTGMTSTGMTSPGMTSTGAEPSPAFAPGKPGHGGWHELHTTNWEAALAFYGAQFGWAQSDVLDMGPMGKYLLFNTGGDAVGGMMNGPDPRPSWLYYFNVEDIDAAKLRVEQAGGAVLNGPHQVPGGSWIVQARDPQDALFALVGPRKAGG